jgi:drug/metabolite transporter (DMT)-like permease
MTETLLYATTVVVWGASWFAVKNQLGVVAPEASLVYRFAVAAAILLVYCVVSRRKMAFSLRAHALMAVQGLSLFCANFLFVYYGIQLLTSGIAAVAFSTLVVMNIVLAAVLLAAPIRRGVLAAAAVGMTGIIVVFWPDLMTLDPARGSIRGLALVLAGTFSASIGTIISARGQGTGLPVIQTSTYGMAYGALFSAAFCLLRGTPFTFDPSLAYVTSLAFLAVFASVVGFWCYLTLLGRIGADRVGYTSVLFPVVALAISTAFEGFQWTATAMVGVGLVLLGNVMILTRGRGKQVPAALQGSTR